MKDMNKIFKKIAHENRTTIAEVKKEISLSIEDAMNNCDLETRKIWQSMSATGGIPTPEEAIEHIRQMVAEQIHKDSLS